MSEHHMLAEVVSKMENEVEEHHRTITSTVDTPCLLSAAQSPAATSKRSMPEAEALQNASKKRRSAPEPDEEGQDDVDEVSEDEMPSLEVKVLRLSGELVCLVDVREDSEQIMKKIATASGIPQRGMELCIDTRTFQCSSIINSNEFVNLLLQMENPIIQLLQIPLANVIWDPKQTDVLFEDAEDADGEEALRLLDKGFVGAVLGFLRDGDADDEGHVYTRSRGVRALKNVLDQGKQAGANHYVDELREGSDLLRSLADWDHVDENWILESASAAVRTIVREHLGEHVPEPVPVFLSPYI
jgi:hypothetical protein